MEGEEEGEQCDGRAVRRAVAGAAACGDETGESPSRLSLSSTGRRVWSASCGRPQKRAGRKSFLALALVDGASSARCGELGRLGPEDVGRAEKSREKVLLGSPPLADLVGARPVAQRVRMWWRRSARAVGAWMDGEALGRGGKGKGESLLVEANFGVGRAQRRVAHGDGAGRWRIMVLSCE